MLENLKQRLISNWSLMRFIRLTLAIILIVQAITNYEILFAVIGGVLLFQAVFNYGCCGMSGCNVNRTTNKSKTLNQNQDTITYTEINKLNMIISEIIYSTASNTCPRCHKGKVFENNNPYSFKNSLVMKDSCTECHLKYEREPGFFYGALYVSYALMSGVFIIWFIADLLWFHMDAVKLTTIVVISMLILFSVVYRSARIVWLNFFFRYDKNYVNFKQNHKHSNKINFTHNQ